MGGKIRLLMFASVCIILQSSLIAEEKKQSGLLYQSVGEKPFIPNQQDELTPLTGDSEIGKPKQDYAVIGNDDRFHVTDSKKYPNRVIGQLKMFFGEQASNCSGALIGEQHILTAAHCIYDQQKQRFADRVYFAPGRNGEELPYGQYGITDIYLPKSYPSSSIEDENSDIAVLKLKQSIGKQLGWLGYRAYSKSKNQVWVDELEKIMAEKNINSERGYWREVEKQIKLLTQQFAEQTITFIAYSGDKNNEAWGDRCLTNSVDSISTEQFPQVTTYCDYQRGASGGAMFDQDNYIIAVNSWHQGSNDTEIPTSEGKSTGNFKGHLGDVRNFSVALSDYSSGWIRAIRNGSTPEATLHRSLSAANDLWQMEILVECNSPVYLAIRYKDEENQWLTKGFYTLDDGDKVRKSISSSTFYYYAKKKNSNSEWSGDDGYYDLYGKSYGFRKRVVDEGKASRTINLNCN